MDSVVNSFNEWDPLEEVIVGTCFGASSMGLGNEPVLENLLGRNFQGFLGQGKPFPMDWLEKAAAELDNLSRVLQNENVIVRRPDEVKYDMPQSSPDWTVPVGNSATCPRDVLIVFGNEIVEAPMSMRARFFEYRAYRSLVQDYWKKGAKWTAAPKPLMGPESFVQNYPAFDTPEREAEIRKGNYGLTEVEPMWDAADFMRYGKDIIGQLSLATNHAGIDWVRRHLGPEYRVHTMSFDNPRPRHIDDTLVPVRPGIVISSEEIPPLNNGFDMFLKSDWTIIKVPGSKNAIPSPEGMQYFTGSLNVNFLSVNERTVVIEQREKDMISLMESLGCRVLQVPLTHVYLIGGSSHCSTVDIRRRGGLQSYFPHLDQAEKKEDRIDF